MTEEKRTVIRTSPMAHFMSGFLALGILTFVLYLPVLAPLLLIPAAMSYAIFRYRTAVDTESVQVRTCLLYTSPSPRDLSTSRMPSSA